MHIAGIFTCVAATYKFSCDLIVRNIKGGLRFITVLHTTQFIPVLHGGGGSTNTPKMYYVIYEQPLTDISVNFEFGFHF